MAIVGIDEISYGVEDLAAGERFFRDWGLKPLADEGARKVFETLNGGRVVLAPIDDPALPPAIEPGSTLREVVWDVVEAADLEALRARIQDEPGFVAAPGWIGCTDPNGLAVRFQVTRKRPVAVEGARMNIWGHADRIDRPSPIYERAEPIEVGHVVFFTDDVAACERFYHERLGFETSDRYPGRGAFMRCAPPRVATTTCSCCSRPSRAAA